MFTIRPLKRLFSTYSDPYYILGIDRNTPFPQIKKTYYKLANQYHPDKNKTSEAQKKFILIKQAFESIKMEKGLMKPQNLYPSNEKESMRPNPDKFKTQQQQQMRNNRDYRVERQKAQDKQQYQRFNASFKTIHDINQIKIKVQKGIMKDPSNRFGLEKYRVKLTRMSNSGVSYLLYFGIGLFVLFVGMNQIYQAFDRQAKQNALKKLEKIHKRKTIDSQIQSNMQIEKQILQKNPQIKQFKQQRLKAKIKKGIRIKPKEQVLNPDTIKSV